ncbi:ABC transporter ATP-binding protein [Streptomyces sp. NBC_01803]|uniref:ABC transporter ATP-binding protein n=1 Tax=Streptomyces sp. NBC_01803 TaxID=2975946 RepID=UPI002DD8A87C|nr:ABC transporter ATP-binding protein [Streptomyces sp. NBC_01803]WSA43311.1 ABC transporter ATP-binding protein [Streptomyces sp. NBC_01803]
MTQTHPDLVPAGPADHPGPDVELRHVVKHYDGHRALDGIDLTVRRGEFLSLLGPSGCGKTTCLKVIAGFEQVTSGDVLLGGAPVDRVPAHRRDVNTVFQGYALFPHLTVVDNVAFGLRQRGLGKAERRRLAEEALDLVALSGQGRRYPAELSGGQQQRVALARALVLRPRVLLLDEPLAALDLKLRRAMQQELKRIHAEVGITFIFVTHDQHEALAMSDRIAVLHAGRIEQLAAPTEIYDTPATPFVAEFIGDLAKLGGTLSEPGLVALDAGPRIPVTRIVADAAAGRRVEIGLRPEQLRLVPAAEGVLTGRVLTSSVIGHLAESEVRLPDGSALLVRQPRSALALGLADFAPGREVGIAWEPGAPLLLGEQQPPASPR